jgi:hypothetical protein
MHFIRFHQSDKHIVEVFQLVLARISGEIVVYTFLLEAVNVGHDLDTSVHDASWVVPGLCPCSIIHVRSIVRRQCGGSSGDGGNFMVRVACVMGRFRWSMSQAFSDIFLSIAEALVHVLFLAVDVVFDVCLDLVSDLYHLFNCRGSLYRENLSEHGDIGVAGFLVNYCLDLALKILSGNVEKGDKAL